jgi:N(2)-fixation sustaining protein CowN
LHSAERSVNQRHFLSPSDAERAMDGISDHYVSFKTIDCEGNSARLIQAVLRHIDDPARTNPFWDRFKQKLAAAENVHARTADGLCLLCSHIYYIEELFEEYEDSDGLALLRQLEDECC